MKVFEYTLKSLWSETFYRRVFLYQPPTCGVYYRSFSELFETLFLDEKQSNKKSNVNQMARSIFHKERAIAFWRHKKWIHYHWRQRLKPMSICFRRVFKMNPFLSIMGTWACTHYRIRQSWETLQGWQERSDKTTCLIRLVQYQSSKDISLVERCPFCF